MTAIEKIFGQTRGLKSAQERQLLELYRRTQPISVFCTLEFAERLGAITADIEEGISVYLNRRGQVVRVAVGTPHQTQIPAHELPRQGAERLCGLRCLSTQLTAHSPSQADLTALALQRLDALVTLEVSLAGKRRQSAAPTGFIGQVHIANLVPEPDVRWVVTAPLRLPQLTDQDFEEFLNGLEAEFREGWAARTVDTGRERVVLVGVFPPDLPMDELKLELEELEQLITSAGGEVLKTFSQRRERPHPRTYIGEGKVLEVALSVQELGANLVVVGEDLSASQSRNLEQSTGVRVVDRTELILDIFARRAHSHEGKMQVELAQLEYLLPRLAGRGQALSRLGGGIGTRGPGETKLETDRRAIRQRISHLQRQVTQLQHHRDRMRQRRQHHDVPVFALVGYTNAGKSTLLNALTGADTFVADQLFATLDATTRRLEFHRNLKVLVTDTVGFVHDLPPQLVDAFRATLEEITQADMLLHVVDLANPSWPAHIEAVEKILSEMPVACGPQMLIFNKVDRAAPAEQELARQAHPKAVFISAQNGLGLDILRWKLKQYSHEYGPYGPDEEVES
ncbi:GTPase HflX [Candidatus Cyanaurora vandensis]|uniref:GTPase HflX n=1 Tax=Candidatus Cyanaurora vandensis TaxID=2714958 RepID=UPI0025803217|nr:GTPase HflX [Candidatus Cyanaurora vandensis]